MKLKGKRKFCKYSFYKLILNTRPFLVRLVTYDQHGSDTTSVTPSFKTKTRCKLYVCQDQFIHTYSDFISA